MGVDVVESMARLTIARPTLIPRRHCSAIRCKFDVEDYHGETDLEADWNRDDREQERPFDWYIERRSRILSPSGEQTM